MWPLNHERFIFENGIKDSKSSRKYIKSEQILDLGCLFEAVCTLEKQASFVKFWKCSWFEAYILSKNCALSVMINHWPQQCTSLLNWQWSNMMTHDMSTRVSNWLLLLMLKKTLGFSPCEGIYRNSTPWIEIIEQLLYWGTGLQCKNDSLESS